MTKTVLIDGDIVLFRVTSSLSGSFDFGDVVMKSCDIEEMKRRLMKDIHGIMDIVGVYEYIFTISAEGNFRKDYFPTYKMNRKGAEKPEGYYELRQWVLDTLDTKIMYKLEADDVMGILGTEAPEKYIIYSQDKDLKTIPCEQWDFKKHMLYTPTEFEALKFLYTQILKGDPVDGYTGIPKIGPKKADVILKDCADEIDLILCTLNAYFAHYGYGWIAVDQMLYQAGQARILHDKDFINLEQGITYNPLEWLFKGEGNG